MSRDHTRGVFLLTACAVLWSAGGLLLKSVDWHPLAVGGGRALIAAAFLVICLRRWRLKVTPLMVAAALAYAGTTLLFAAATKLTTAANAILLQYTAPVYIALLSSWLLGERATGSDWAAIAVVLGGMALFFVDQLSASGFLGNLIAIASGVAFALMTLLLRKQKDAAPVDSIILGNLIAGLIGLPFMLTSPLPGVVGWAALFGLGIFQLGLSYLLYSVAIRHVTALEAILVAVIEPILNPIWVMLLLGEKPGPFALLGGAIVVSAVTARACDRQTIFRSRWMWRFLPGIGWAVPVMGGFLLFGRRFLAAQESGGSSASGFLAAFALFEGALLLGGLRRNTVVPPAGLARQRLESRT
jgi:drug/metabolite transporter (DMT)-like permease